jgi:hypothetical protein
VVFPGGTSFSSNSYIEIDNAASLQGTSFTVSAWIRMDSVVAYNAWNFWFIEGDATESPGSNLHLGFQKDAVSVDFSFEGNNDLSWTSSQTFTGGAWHLWTWTYDYPSLTKTIFLDGVNSSSGVASGQLSGGGGLTPIYLGGSPQNFAPYFLSFNGGMKDLRVYKRTLSGS